MTTCNNVTASACSKTANSEQKQNLIVRKVRSEVTNFDISFSQ